MIISNLEQRNVWSMLLAAAVGKVLIITLKWSVSSRSHQVLLPSSGWRQSSSIHYSQYTALQE